jgi:hypothetical protein
MSIITNQILNKADVSSSHIGTLCFIDNTPFVIQDNNNKYKVWNFNEVSMHTFGYPQMNATIDGIYTSYRAGTKFEFSLLKNNEAYLSVRIWE